jgi:flavin reductase (DIM6/NTAB) family NADH-FMN oxidoreductase RutF
MSKHLFIMRTFNAADLTPQQNYKLLAGSVLPRPIAFVSTIDGNGIRNLAPFSFFTVASANPPIVVFCPLFRPENPKRLASTKDTLANIQSTKEFVLNVVSEDFVEKMNQAAAEVPPDIDEWELSGLTALASQIVKPPRVGESRVQMECRLLQIVVASDKPLGGTLILGEVLRFHLAEHVVSEELNVDPDKLNAVGRMAGAAYIRTRDRFDLQRPK